MNINTVKVIPRDLANLRLKIGFFCYFGIVGAPKRKENIFN